MKHHRKKRILTLLLTATLAVSALSAAAVAAQADEEAETHIHNDACYATGTLVCDLGEHTHDTACGQWEMICGQGEAENHIHSDLCYEQQLACGFENADAPAPMAATTYRSKVGSTEIEDDGVKFTYTLYDDLTAECTKLTAPATPQEVTVPASIPHDGQDYRVTVLNLVGSFNTLRNITKLNLPSSLVSLQGYYRLPDMTEFTVPGSVKVSTAMFQGCSSLTTLIFEEGVEEINCESMVSSCAALETVKLPSTLRLISENYTFTNATGLKTINLPEGVRILGIGNFSGCTALTEITLPASIASIPSNTFSGCSKLEHVYANGAITAIGKKAFYNCKVLEDIPDLSSVTEMEASAFEGCTYLKCEDGILDLSSLNVIPEKAFYKAGAAESLYPEVIQGVKFSDELLSIGNDAFSGCTMLWKGLAFPDTLETIGANAFKSIASTVTIPDSMTSTVTIPDSVTSIGKQAFYGANVQEVSIGSGVDEIASGTFTKTSITKITINNAEESVIIAGDAIPDGVVVEWMEASIGDVGDTISNDEHAMTLQQAVDTAPDDVPTTITISKNIQLDTTLLIPAHKKITITSSGGEAYTIIGNKEKAISDLIAVAEEAEITLENVMLSGAFNSSSVIRVQGNATLSTGVVVKKSNIQSGSSGVIEVNGDGATLVMQEGVIEGNKISTEFCGVIRITNGGSAFIEGGFIQNNKVALAGTKYASSSGILLYEDGSCTMSGGTISGNQAVRGSAVLLYSFEESKQAKFTLSGGIISENICKNMGLADAGGAVGVEGYSLFTMTDGLIDRNTGGSGAGVCVLDNGLLVNNGEFKPEFIMNGGTISNNTAAKAGGGIYSFSNGVQLNVGIISGNRAAIGGGIYSEGNTTSYSTLHMKNAVITGNTSADQGGGLWLCSTGDAEVYVMNGGAIYGNEADGAGDDVISVKAFSGTTSSITLADRLLGGGKVQWYKDGGIYRIVEDHIYAVTNKDVKRYESGISERVEVDHNQDHLALKAVVDPTAAALADRTATLRIEGNSATDYGGGVGANGGVVIGESTENLIDIPVKKVWDHGDNGAVPTAVVIRLMVGDTVMDTLILDGTVTDQKGNWVGTFEDLLPGLEYTVVEESVANYVPEVTGNATDGFTVKNTYSPSVGSLFVHKTVSGSGGSNSKEFRFTVHFTGDGLADSYPYSMSNSEETGMLALNNGEAAFTLKHDQSITITGLPAGIGFEITESDNNGYTVTSQVIGEDTTAESTIQGAIVGEKTTEVIFNNHKGGGSGGTYTSVSVKKVWKLDDGGTATDAVQVALLRNGVEYETVTLGENNGWGHTWSRLNDNYIWTVQEVEVPEGFTASIDRGFGNSFTITNDDEPRDDPEEPEDPDEPEIPDIPDEPDTPEEPGLPQTGQSWWPVVLVLTLGGGMLLVGVHDMRKRRYHGKHEK